MSIETIPNGYKDIISSLDAKPNTNNGLSASALQSKFDYTPNMLVDKVNEIIEVLNNLGDGGSTSDGSIPSGDRLNVNSITATSATLTNATIGTLGLNGDVTPNITNAYLGNTNNRFSNIYTKNINVSGNAVFGGSPTWEATHTTASVTNTNYQVIFNRIVDMGGCVCVDVGGQFRTASDGIASGQALFTIPIARPSKDIECWAFAQKNDGTVLRGTAKINSGGGCTITTQDSTSFRYFRVHMIIPKGY